MDLNAFKHNLVVYSAVQHQMMIIGEATKLLPQNFRANYTDVPWKAMSGMRDVLIHQYHNANPEEIWEAISHDIPPLIPQIEKILKILNESS